MKTSKGQQKEIAEVEPLPDPPEMIDDDDNDDDRVEALKLYNKASSRLFRDKLCN